MSIEVAEASQPPDRGAPVAALKTRLPRTPQRVVRRQRLLDRLRRVASDPAGDCGVVLVTGPAGAGKTTLVAEWLSNEGAARDIAPAWVTVDRTDSVVDLWTAILAALASSGAMTGTDGLQALQVPRDTADDGFVARVTQKLSQVSRPLWLVLDEVENLVDDQARHSVDLLLRWLAPPVVVVLVGRSEPGLAIHRLRVEGRLIDVRQDDLAFTREEASAVLAGHGVTLDDADLDLLLQRTEGWAAGVRMAALSLEDVKAQGAGIREFLVNFDGDDRAVADYLVNEVLSRQPVDVVDFLRQTSICSTLSPELAIAVTGRQDAGAVLEDLVRRNALTARLEGPGRWYRCHGMLRAYLHADLRRHGPDGAAALHARASDAYAAQRDVLVALEHAVAAGDPVRTGRLLSDGGLALVMRGQARAVLREVQRAPTGALDPVRARLVAAAAALDIGDVATARAHLTAGDSSSDPWANALRATLDVQRARLEGAPPGRGDELVRRLDSAVAAGSGDPDLDLLALAERGRLLLWQEVSADITGRVGSAERDLTAAATLASAAGHDHLALSCLSRLATTRGSLRLTGERARAAIDFAARRGWDRTPSCAFAHLAAGWSAYQSLDPAAADHVAAAEEVIDSSADPTTRAALLALRGAMSFDAAMTGEERRRGIDRGRRMWDEFGDTHLTTLVVAFAAVIQTRQCLAVGMVSWADDIRGHARDRLGDGGEVRLVTAMLEAARGRAATARNLLAAVLSGERTCVVPQTLIEALVLDAVLADGFGETERAHQDLVRALDIAEDRGSLCAFTGNAPVVHRILVRGLGRFGRLEPLAVRLVAATDDGRRSEVVYLSEREREVLRELPALQSVGEIADRLYLSVNTVKTHLRNVYRKLDVGNRRDAISAARRLGLL